MIEISVIIPAYNCEKYVEEAIDSALNQDFPKNRYEIIIVDDCSTDKTGRMADRYAKHKNVKVIHHKKNKGETNAIRTGLKNLSKTSKYICHLDADDIYEHNKLSEQYKYIQESGADMIYSNGWYINENGSKKWEYNVFPFDSRMLRRFNMISEGSVFIKREAMEAVGGPDPKLLCAEDWSLWLSVDEAGYKIEKQPNFRSYHFRQHGEMKSKTNKKYDEYLKMIRKKHGIKEDFVCVGVPAYNVDERFFLETLNSILTQSYPQDRYEVIVYDDGSDNGVAEKVCDEFKKKSNNLKYIKGKKNKGIGYARNQLLDAIPEKATHFAFLSADDLWTPDFLRIMMEFKNQFYDHVLYCCTSSIDENSNILMEFNQQPFTSFEDLCMSAVTVAEQDKMFINFSSLLMPVEAVKNELFLENLKYGEDLEYLLRLLLINHQKFMCIPANLTRFRIHKDAMTTEKWDDLHENNNKIRRRINELTNQKIFENV